MKLDELTKKVTGQYKEKNIAHCRHNALSKVIDYLKEIGVEDSSILLEIDKSRLKSSYEGHKGIKINGAENQAINDLYRNANAVDSISTSSNQQRNNVVNAKPQKDNETSGASDSMIMNYKEEKERLVANGFKGFVTVAELKENNVAPRKHGVYAILRESDEAPKFLKKGCGGFFKDKDPNVELGELESDWISDTHILYYGKASKSIHTRLGQYMSFGCGKAVGHYGGRYIWQLEDSDELIVCWKETTDKDPREEEKALIQEFKCEHNGNRPFANLKD